MRLRARMTVIVPATSVIPLNARLGSTSGAGFDGAGVGSWGQGLGYAYAAAHAKAIPAASVEYLNNFFIVTLSVGYLQCRVSKGLGPRSDPAYRSRFTSKLLNEFSFAIRIPRASREEDRHCRIITALPVKFAQIANIWNRFRRNLSYNTGGICCVREIVIPIKAAANNRGPSQQ